MEKKKSYNQKNDLNLKLLIALNRGTNHLRQYELMAITGAGLTLSQFAVLEMLYHKGPLKICQIIEKSLLTSGNMTVVVRNLEKNGMVVFQEDPLDRRAKIIAITKKGERLIEDIFPEHLGNIEEALASLSDNDKQELIGLLKKLGGRGPQDTDNERK